MSDKFSWDSIVQGAGFKPDVENNNSLLKDKYKEKLGALDLFDRVINLKLTTTNGEEYVIRSDYETYFPNTLRAVTDGDYTAFLNNKCLVRKCQYKPSIKIQYKRVSMDTPISVDIFINNFFMLDKNGKMLKTFSNLYNPLSRVEVQMGYFGQFQEALQKGKASDISVDSLFDFNVDNLKGHGITVITMSDVEYVQTDKLPPDMTVHIHGYVGNLYTDKLSATAKVEEGFDNLLATKQVIDYTSMSKDKESYLWNVFYNSVTKNWANKGRLPKDSTIKIANASSYMVAGTLTDEEADNYGIQVYFSKGADKWARKWEDSFPEDADGNIVFPVVKIASASTALAKVNAVKNAFNLTEFCVTEIPSSGDLLIYLNTEVKTASTLLEGTSLASAYESDTVNLYWDNKLPAVYNITTDALCTITCPFFFFLNPFQKFYFKSAYALSGLVSYYASFTASEDEFYALWQTVSFATVEDINECTIVCTGKKQEK